MYSKYKHNIGETVKAMCTFNVIDNVKGDGHTNSITKEVEGVITNSTPLLVCGKIEVWYDIINDKDIVFHIKEDDIVE